MLNWEVVLVEENILTGVMCNVFETYRRNNNDKHSGIGWLLIDATDAQEKDNEWMRVYNRQLKSRCKSQRTSWLHTKEALINSNGRVEKVKV